MSTELIDKLEDVVSIADSGIGTQKNVTLIFDYECIVDVSVMKVGNDTFSFGYSISARGNDYKVRCGTNTFTGNMRRILIGFIKAIARKKDIRQIKRAVARLDEMTKYLYETAGPIENDESKVDLEKWTIPEIFRKISLV